MEATTHKTLKQLIKAEPALEVIFEKYGLDFFIGNKQAMEKACLSEHINVGEIQRELENVFNHKIKNEQKVHYSEMELDKLVGQVLIKHAYLKYMLPVLSKHINNIAANFGIEHPELKEIKKLFHEIRVDLEQHMFREEEVLFPYIKKLTHAKHENDHHSFAKGHFIDNPIRVMVTEHKHTSELMAQIHKLSDNFNLPGNVSINYKLCFLELHEFEKAIQQDVHLENDILFPKAKALENILNKITLN